MTHAAFALVIILACALIAIGQDISKTWYSLVYTNLNNWPCVRLLDATTVIGCHSRKTGSGVLYNFNTQNEIDLFVSGIKSISNDVAIVIPYNLLTAGNIRQLEATGRTKGIIVLLRGLLPSEDITSSRSPDTQCPNCKYSLYASDPEQHVWNPQGLGILEESFSIPIFALDSINAQSAQVYELIQQGLAYNREREYNQYPLQALDFDLFMWAAVNAQTCLRRGWCLPVGGQSVYSTPSLDMQATDGKPIIVVSAAMDSRSFFHDMTVGASNELSGMIALLAVADTLSRAPVSLSTLPKHILYTLFTAEPWGFAGSQRFVKDISTPFQCSNSSRAYTCPYSNAPCTNPCVRNLEFTHISFEHIETVIEFNSVSGINSNGTGYWAHVDNIDTSGPVVSMAQAFSGSNQAPIRPAYQDGIQRRLPPSSAMSFLAKNPSIKAVVITDYQDQMGSLFSSDLDDTLDVHVVAQSICALANATAKTVYLQAQNSNDTTLANQLSTNCTLIESLLDCLVKNFSCPFMQNYINATGVSRVSHYSSVFDFRNPQPQLIPRFAFSFLAGVTGVQRPEPVPCQTIRDCQIDENCILQRCVRSMTSYHDAYGTGLHYDEGRGEVVVIDPSKPTWTESTWDVPMIRMFLVTSKSQQIIELVVGILWTLVSVITVLGVKKYAVKMLKTD